MANINVPRGQNENPHNRVMLIRDLAGRRVRMTLYRRDVCSAHLIGAIEGQQGPFDMDDTAEGIIVSVARFLPLRNTLWGIQLDNGEIRFGFLSPTDPTEMENSLSVPSQWDGRRNGTYKIEEIQ